MVSKRFNKKDRITTLSKQWQYFYGNVNQLLENGEKNLRFCLTEDTFKLAGPWEVNCCLIHHSRAELKHWQHLTPMLVIQIQNIHCGSCNVQFLFFSFNSFCCHLGSGTVGTCNQQVVCLRADLGVFPEPTNREKLG